MKKVFDFGKIAYNGIYKNNLVTVEMEYKEDNEKKILSVVGNIWNARHTDIVHGGQCLDTIAEYIKDPIFLQIFRLWKLYHFNDMHPECEHQRELGWLEESEKRVLIYNWCLSDEAGKRKKAAETKALNALRNGETFIPEAQDVFYANLKNFCTTYTPEAPECYDIEKNCYNDKQKIDVKELGDMCSTEHPDGILCKPCPVCGYTYGSEWLYVPIPNEDEKIIYSLLKDEKVVQ